MLGYCLNSTHRHASGVRPTALHANNSCEVPSSPSVILATSKPIGANSAKPALLIEVEGAVKHPLGLISFGPKPAPREATRPSRRNFLHLVAGTAATAPYFGWARDAPATSQPVRVAAGLLATWQSTAWLGAEAGLFKKRGSI